MKSAWQGPRAALEDRLVWRGPLAGPGATLPATRRGPPSVSTLRTWMHIDVGRGDMSMRLRAFKVLLPCGVESNCKEIWRMKQ